LRVSTRQIAGEWNEAMKLVVLGATGGIGKEIVRQSIGRGHDVTAFVRTPEPLKALGTRLSVIQGDLLNSSRLAHVVRGHDAVLSGFGPRVPISTSDADLLRRFAVSLTRGMQEAGVRRAVIVSTAFLFRDSILPPAHLIGLLFFRGIVEDSSAMEEILKKSGLDWTLVRPPQLTDKPATGRYRVREGHLPVFGFQISRADVADFMIKAAESSSHTRSVVGVSN
jgi:putative NADH-flavin reductase